MSTDVRVNRRLTIPADEIELSFTTSGGPGGQHANKASTAVELTWNVDRSRVLGPRQSARLRRNLAGRIDQDGNLRLTGREHRSQSRNREAVLARLGSLVRGALAVPRRRVPTRPSPAARERRLRQKRRRSEIKRLRRPPADG